MSSQALRNFGLKLADARLLINHAARLRKGTDRQEKTIFLHAALAAQVATWESYIKGIAREYFLVTASTADIRFSAMHALLNALMLEANKKLNTPDSEHARTFLLKYTNFDIWPCWVNVKFGNVLLGSVLLARNRLDEILSIRHSFAHGFTMPAHAWNTDASGAPKLTCSIVRNTESFFNDLCTKTDVAFGTHIATQHSIARQW